MSNKEENKDLTVINNNLPSTIISSGSLESYIRWANSVPMLTKEEEVEFAEKLQNKNDLAAAQKLVTSHMRYVIKVAKGYMGYGLMLNDLIQEGTIGLMKAVKRFQPNKGVRLVSFAIHWIKSEIHEFVLRNWRIVKVATTKPQRKLFFNLKKSKKSNTWLTQEEINTIAKDLDVKPKEVETMEKRLYAHDSPFDMPANDSSFGDNQISTSPVEYLESDNKNPLELVENSNWDTFTKSRFRGAFKKLDARSQDIIQKRWLTDDENKSTLLEIADKYNITPERVRQLEQKAINSLKEAVCE